MSDEICIKENINSKILNRTQEPEAINDPISGELIIIEKDKIKPVSLNHNLPKIDLKKYMRNCYEKRKEIILRL